MKHDRGHDIIREKITRYEADDIEIANTADLWDRLPPIIQTQPIKRPYTIYYKVAAILAVAVTIAALLPRKKEQTNNIAENNITPEKVQEQPIVNNSPKPQSTEQVPALAVKNAVKRSNKNRINKYLLSEMQEDEYVEEYSETEDPSTYGMYVNVEPGETQEKSITY